MKITLSKKQWEFIGKKTGWMKTSYREPEYDFTAEELYPSNENEPHEHCKWCEELFFPDQMSREDPDYCVECNEFLGTDEGQKAYEERRILQEKRNRGIF